ncbi:osteoclast-associated immunoglobulin-like receptor [Tenrec ecaudatus]|uniref:osteoclast-associated immunoglobulin-like receptor n=1 Tax=Tenrec ecaudatus TaxID=94439 RepID=UPI003F5A28AA
MVVTQGDAPPPPTPPSSPRALGVGRAETQAGLSLQPHQTHTPSHGSRRPGAVVAPGANVTLRCWAPQAAWRFALFKAGEMDLVQLWDVADALAEFFLEEVAPDQGGSYHCCYRRQGWGPGAWSRPSNVLEPLVTETLPRPTLEALPGPVVARGANLCLHCAGRVGGMSFALYSVGEAAPQQYRHSARRWADFPLPAARVPGTYSCCYSTPAAPYLLSPRSERLEVRWDDALPRDYTRGNIIHLWLAAPVFICLCILMVLGCH